MVRNEHPTEGSSSCFAVLGTLCICHAACPCSQVFYCRRAGCCLEHPTMLLGMPCPRTCFPLLHRSSTHTCVAPSLLIFRMLLARYLCVHRCLTAFTPVSHSVHASVTRSFCASSTITRRQTGAIGIFRGVLWRMLNRTGFARGGQPRDSSP